MTGGLPGPPSATRATRSHSISFPRHGQPSQPPSQPPVKHIPSPAPPPPAPGSPPGAPTRGCSSISGGVGGVRADLKSARRSSTTAAAAITSDQFVIDHLGTLGLGRHQSFNKMKDGESAQLQRLGKAINLSVERFVTVGETIGELDRKDMLEACRETRRAGKLVEKLSENLAVQSGGGGGSLATAILEDEVMAEHNEDTSLISASRTLITAITKVLLLADSVVVKQLLLDKELHSNSPVAIQHMNNFSEFVKAFCDFGQEMVDLTSTTRWSSSQVKTSRQRAQIECARQVLDRSTVLLITSTKCCLRHPDSSSARENRDTVFCQMRRVIDLIHFVVREGVSPDPSEDLDLMDMPGVPYQTNAQEESTLGLQTSLLGSLRQFDNSIDLISLSIVSPSYCEQISSLLDSIVERTQDFTDSAYTTHDHRQNIILLRQRCKLELDNLLRLPGVSSHILSEQESRLHERASDSGLLSMSRGVLHTSAELRTELIQTAVEHTKFLSDHARRGADILHAVRTAGFASDHDRLQVECDLFAEHIDYVEDVCKLISHVSTSESERVKAKHSQVNLHIYGPQIIVASSTFCVEPTSKIAKETFENFCDMWRFLINDVIQVSKDILESFKVYPSPVIGSNQGLQPPGGAGKIFSNHFSGAMDQCGGGGGGYRPRTSGDGLLYPQDGVVQPLPPPPHRLNNNMLPPPGRSHQHYPFDRGPPDGMPYRNESVWSGEGYGGGHGGGGRQGAYMPGNNSSRSGMTTAHDILETFKDVGDENEILKRARGMLTSAQAMHNFTLGEGKIRTTQDFFTKAESFSEEANKLYKLIRMFSYTVPTGEDKRILMQAADNLPRHCGQMQLLIQLPGVGKESTFRKVDSIIKENNQIMYLIAKVVELCFLNAKKYELDFRRITLSSGAGDGNDSSTPFGSTSGGAGAGSSSLDSGIGFGSSRRGGAPAAGSGGNKRTRVSFLLY